MSWFLVFLGGGLGSLLRYMLGVLLQKYAFFPVATLCVNLLGGFLIGICFFVFAQKESFLSWKLFCMIGFLGGFTTFSSFGLELFVMLKNFEYQKAILYLMVTNFFVILFVCFGYLFARKMAI